MQRKNNKINVVSINTIDKLNSVSRDIEQIHNLSLILAEHFEKKDIIVFRDLQSRYESLNDVIIQQLNATNNKLKNIINTLNKD